MKRQLYAEDIDSVSLKISDTCQKELGLDDIEDAELYDELLDCLNKYFRYPDYKHYL